MKLKLTYSQKQLFLTWASFVTTVLGTILIISLLLYSNFEKSTLNMINNLNSQLLEKEDNISSHMKDMMKVSTLQVFNDPAVEKLRNEIKLSSLNKIEGIRKMDSLIGIGGNIHSVYVYNGALNYIFSTGNYISSEANYFWDKGIINSIKTPIKEGQFVPIPRTIKAPLKYEQIYSFVLQEQNKKNNTVESAIVINVYAEWLNDILKLYDDRRSIIVIDSKGHVVNYDKQDYFMIDVSSYDYVQRVLNEGKASGYFIDTVDGVKTIVSYVKSKETNWYFVRNIPYTEAMKDINKMKFITLIVIISVLGIGFAGCIVLLLKILMPFNKILGSIEKTEEITNSNTIGHLIESFEHIITSGTENEAIKRDYSRILKTELLKNFINGRYSDAITLEENFKEYNISIKPSKPIYILAILEETRTMDYNKIIKENYLEASAEVISIEKINIILLQNITFKKAYTAAELVCAKVGRPVAMSREVKGVEDVTKAVDEVKNLLNYHILYPIGQVLTGEVVRDRKSDFKYPITMENEMIRAMKNNNLEKTIECYKTIMEFIKNFSYEDIRFAVIRLYLPVKLVYRELSSISLEETQDSDIAEIENILCSVCSFEEINKKFIDMFKVIIRENGEQKNSRSALLVAKIIDMIEEKYEMPGLSLQMLASDIGMSHLYVGRIFKTTQGLSVSEYINEVRVRKAKELLINTNKSIKEIANKVGFSNENYFFTLFKASEGKTPKEFRLAYKI